MSPTETTNQTSTQLKAEAKRYYWLKLPTNFFFSDDVKVILAQQGGEKYVLFWLKLLLKALEQEEIGVLRYKSDVPYTPEVLAAVTDTDPDVVRSALTLFDKLGLINNDPDGSIIIDSIHGYVGSVSDSAIRMRRLRERQKSQIAAPQEPSQASQSDVSPSQCDVEIEKNKSRERGEESTAASQPLAEDRSIYHFLEKAFVNANPEYFKHNTSAYGKEGPAVKKLEEIALDQPDPLSWAQEFLDTAQRMRESGDKWYSSWPFLASTLCGNSVLPRILNEMKRNEVDPEIEKIVEGMCI